MLCALWMEIKNLCTSKAMICWNTNLNYETGKVSMQLAVKSEAWVMQECGVGCPISG